MRNIRFVVSYDGTHYSGFQTQPSGNTVQDQLEKAILKLTGETVKVTSSGRTDAGVHARAQVCNFHTDSRIPVERWSMALNSRLPSDIVVRSADEVPETFHARKSAKRKTYSYFIRCSKFHDVFERAYQYHHPGHLDIAAMKDAITAIVGEHDFTSFCSVHTELESKVRTIYEAAIEHIPDAGDLPETSGVLKITVTGNGFLYNMVRIIVGTLIEIGEGKRPAAEMRAILEARDRSRAGPTAMAHGLMLWSVEY
ncbi:tRNA pseudouridine(38-40) synthase TruA [Paenibacillus chartarius]|uniref:tRNA pseudouridine synthase A n=1 Tax=Paenibacillus chartarius TaxID=747481 RepID=A0ABV6DJI3_9BACL